MAYGSRFLCSLVVLGCSAGCGDDPPAQTPNRDVKISFEARVGEQELDCSSTYSALSDASIKDFRFYIHDVTLHTADGKAQPVSLYENDFQYRDVALLDFEDNSELCAESRLGTDALHKAITGSVPDGEYTKLSFRVGVPSDLNHTNFATSEPPLNESPLSWEWALGRIFVRLDVQTPEGATMPVHLAATGCTGNPRAGEAVSCARPNVAHVELAEFSLNKSKVVVDVAALLAGVSVTSGTQGRPAACHSSEGNAVCQSVFANLGVDPSTGAPTTPAQPVFRTETP